MRALFWKEWRAVRWVLPVGSLGVLGLYLLNLRDELELDPRFLVALVAAFLGADAPKRQRKLSQCLKHLPLVKGRIRFCRGAP